MGSRVKRRPKPIEDGFRSGHLIVVSGLPQDTGEASHKSRRWQVLCHCGLCGNPALIPVARLRVNGRKPTSCGCWNRPDAAPSKDSLRKIRMDIALPKRQTALWKGKERTLVEIARMEAVPYNTLRDRINSGETLSAAVLPGKRYRRKSNHGLTTEAISEVSRRTGISSKRLRYRMRAGLTLEEAVAVGRKRVQVIPPAAKGDVVLGGSYKMTGRSRKQPSRESVTQYEVECVTCGDKKYVNRHVFTDERSKQWGCKGCANDPAIIVAGQKIRRSDILQLVGMPLHVFKERVRLGLSPEEAVFKPYAPRAKLRNRDVQR